MLPVPYSDISNKTEQENTSISKHLTSICEDRPSVKLTQGKASKSCVTIRRIISSALAVFIDFGHSGLTLRRVAEHAGIAVGNLTYHFPTKQELLDAMLSEARADYVQDQLARFEKKTDTPVEVLLNVMENYVRDARESHQFFLQLWGYAASSEYGKEKVAAFYQPQGRIIYYLVRRANPALSDPQIRQAVLQISSLEEGFKVFIATGANQKISTRTAELQMREMTKKIVFSSWENVPSE